MNFICTDYGAEGDWGNINYGSESGN